MKKRLLSMIMVLIMLVSGAALSGCSNKDSAAGTAASEPAAEAETSTAAAETTENDAAPADEAAVVEPLTIKFSSTYQETETGGAILKHFIDKVGELSGDAVQVEISWGGTLFTANDELDAVIDGSVDMVALGHMPHLNTLPYLAFPSFAPGGSKAALDYFQTLMFDDPETSALIQGEASDLGIKYLNVIAGGGNAFCAKYEFTDMDSLVAGSTAFGNMDAAIFEKLGLQVTSVFPPDVYDGLNRGLIDSTQMALTPMVAMSWYEPAKYWALDGTYAAGNFFTVNLDWWDGLTDAQREVIQAASSETQEYTATLYDDAIANDVATVEEKTGNKFVEFSAEDINRMWAATFEAKSASALELAEASGKTEGMIKILEKAAEITGYDWQH